MSASPGSVPQTGATPQSALLPHSPFSHCGNPGCATGWIHLWRSRRAPVFEGRWACSPGCMGELVHAAVRREIALGAGAPYRHRIPLGLLLLSQGHITQKQLGEGLRHQELAARRDPYTPRLGEWLVESGILSESALTRALSAQWNCPVFSPGACRAADVAAVLPRLLAESLGAVPLRLVGGRILCLAFSRRIDRTLGYAAERMLGLSVASGIVRDSECHTAQAEFLTAPAPRARFLETSGSASLPRLFTALVEDEKPLEARLARVHGFWWLRLWRRVPCGFGLPDCGDVEDVLCTAEGPAAGAGWRESAICR
jgi:hypothetical protein